MADRAGGNFQTIVARQITRRKAVKRGSPILNKWAVRLVVAAALRRSRPLLRGELGKGDPVNRERLYPDAELRRVRFLAERVLVERQRHELCASVISSSAPTIWAPLVSTVCERTFDGPWRAPCSGVT
jgi:hypothetical protein